jgi:hypothetical protein
MTTSVWMLSLLLVPSDGGPTARSLEMPIQNGTLSPLTAEAMAVKSLDDPLGTLPDGNFSGAKTLCNQSYRYYFGCEDQIHLLVHTKAGVNHDLLEHARTTKSLRVRYRAAYILIQRRCAFVVAVLDGMCASRDAEERYLAWNAYRMALSEGDLKPPKGFERPLKLFAREQNPEVRREIIGFFGEAKASDAAPALIECLEKKQDSQQVICALGEIRDPKAVPAIIKAFENNIDPHSCLEALGKLATAEAVDFIIENLDKYGAVKALCNSHSDKALPALKKHLEHLQRATDNGGEVCDTRIAIIRLANEDPRDSLLKLAEDARETGENQLNALLALREYETAPLHPRILKIYKNADDVDIKRCCIQLLKDGTIEGITEAMLAHLLNCTEADSKQAIGMQNELRNALNKRLDKSFRQFDDLQAYVRALRKEN